MRKAGLVIVLLLSSVLVTQAQTVKDKKPRSGTKGQRSVPMLLNYQGYLAGSDTMPFTGLADMTFKIFNQPVGGTALWEESHADLPVTKGFFNVVLNSVAQDQIGGLFDGSQLYLETTVEGQVLSPRKPLSSVGYALRAQKADTADWSNGVIGDKWGGNGSDIYNTNSGNVGIGTDNPVGKLDINGGAVFRRIDGDTVGRWSVYNNSVSSVGDFGLYFEKSGPGLYLVLGNSSNNSYFPNGNLGVGTATPAVKFDVSGYVRSTGYDDVGGGLSVFNSSKTGATANNWTIYNMTGAYGNALKFWRYYQNGSNPGPTLTLWDDGNAAFAGNVGIGQDFPSYKLDVAGTTRTTGLLIPTGASSGHVLTSDASGNATWQAPGTGPHNHLGEDWSSSSTSPTDGLIIELVNNNSASAYRGGCFVASGYGTGNQCGLYSRGSVMTNGASTNDAYGIFGEGSHEGTRNAYGGFFQAGSYSSNGTGNKYGIYCTTFGWGNRYAGYFSGNVIVTGSLSKGSGSFLIDHPLDPQNKTLRHNFVESPENLCLYRGKVKLNSSGEGRVEMPSYFKALTKEAEATVTLTSIGRPFNTGYEWNADYTVCTVYGDPNREVSYIVMADRDDPVMRQLYKPVEQDKGKGNFTRGKLLYPEAYGYPKELGETYEMEQRATAQHVPAKKR